MLYAGSGRSSNNSFADRRTIVSRPMNDCETPNAYFQSSHCTPRRGGLRRWRIHCHLPYDISHPETHEYLSRAHVAASKPGTCREDENCVDTRDTNSFGETVNVATCVNQEDYVLVSQEDYVLAEGDAENVRTRPAIPLGRTRAGLVFSNTDRKTPFAVDMLDVKAGTAGNMVQDKTCRDCMGLHSDVLEPNTELLRAETTLLTTGAVAGILWLTLVSG